MAIFGKKKQLIADDFKLPPDIQALVDQKLGKTSAPQKINYQVAQKESQFSSPDDLMKTMNEQEMPHTEALVPKPAQTTYLPAQYHTQTPIMPVQSPTPQTPQAVAPLFIKIDKYNNILKSLTELKTTMTVMKNSLSALNQLDQIRNENMNLILNALDKVEKKITALDVAFLRPANLQEGAGENEEFESLQNVMSDLQSQIAQLKNQVQEVE